MASRWVHAERRRLRCYRLVTVFHARPGGRLVPRGETSWRTANGLMVNTRWGHAWALFRRALPR